VRLIAGHTPGGAPAANWDFDVLAPAGALRSTADDMLRFIRANLATTGGGEDALAGALATALEVQTPAGISPMGLGWHRLDLAGRAVWWHNGGTGGYASFLAIDPAARTGVVVLANYGDAMAGSFAVDEIGMAVLGSIRE
jgi:CubicO group peptidase (beta-lactamase class C family)